MKLVEHWAGERMLVACLYKKCPCEYKEEYEEHMMCVPKENALDSWCRETCLTWEQHERGETLPPLNERELKRKAKLIEEYKPYQGKTLNVGDKEYAIYNSNRDFMPCGNAPEIPLSTEEVAAWRAEFSDKKLLECGPFISSKWGPFDDELFLK
jgi:hypothetical protein